MSILLSLLILSILGIAIEYWQFKLRGENGWKKALRFLLIVFSIVFQIVMVMVIFLVIIITYIPLKVYDYHVRKKDPFSNGNKNDWS